MSLTTLLSPPQSFADRTPPPNVVSGDRYAKYCKLAISVSPARLRPSIKCSRSVKAAVTSSLIWKTNTGRTVERVLGGSWDVVVRAGKKRFVEDFGSTSLCSVAPPVPNVAPNEKFVGFSMRVQLRRNLGRTNLDQPVGERLRALKVLKTKSSTFVNRDCEVPAQPVTSPDA